MGHWVSVEEKVPETDGNYRVISESCGEHHTEESIFIKCNDGDYFWTSQNVIAWMEENDD